MLMLLVNCFSFTPGIRQRASRGSKMHFNFLVFTCLLACIHADANVRVANRVSAYKDDTAACPRFQSILDQNLRKMEKSLEKKMLTFSSYTQSRNNGDDMRIMLSDIQNQLKTLQTDLVYVEKRMRTFVDDETKRVLGSIDRVLRTMGQRVRPSPGGEVNNCRDGRCVTPSPDKPMADECSNGYIWIGRGQSSKCVKYVNERKSFNEAESTCRREGGHLISIRTNAEKGSISAYLIYFNRVATKQRDGIWIGLRKDTRTYQWAWSGGGALDSTWSYWEYQQPDGRYMDADGQARRADPGCVYMALNRGSKMKWSDTACDVSLPFVCQKPLLIEQK